ncbi:MAG TPA: acyltransferase, partial [Perlabentimonas sp.]|nr:acyltransferase [Perlabentimonas sp.]
CYIDARNGIILEDNVWIGPRVSLISMDHNLLNYNYYKEERPIRIGRDCLLTTNSIVLPGVLLGPHTVVAAGAVVTKSFPQGNVILAGNPAKVVKALQEYSTKS